MSSLKPEIKLWADSGNKAAHDWCFSMSRILPLYNRSLNVPYILRKQRDVKRLLVLQGQQEYLYCFWSIPDIGILFPQIVMTNNPLNSALWGSFFDFEKQLQSWWLATVISYRANCWNTGKHETLGSQSIFVFSLYSPPPHMIYIQHYLILWRVTEEEKN